MSGNHPDLTTKRPPVRPRGCQRRPPPRPPRGGRPAERRRPPIIVAMIRRNNQAAVPLQPPLLLVDDEPRSVPLSPLPFHAHAIADPLARPRGSPRERERRAARPLHSRKKRSSSGPPTPPLRVRQRNPRPLGCQGHALAEQSTADPPPSRRLRRSRKSRLRNNPPPLAHDEDGLNDRLPLRQGEASFRRRPGTHPYVSLLALSFIQQLPAGDRPNNLPPTTNTNPLARAPAPHAPRPPGPPPSRITARTTVCTS